MIPVKANTPRYTYFQIINIRIFFCEAPGLSRTILFEAAVSQISFRTPYIFVRGTFLFSCACSMVRADAKAVA